MGIPPAEFLRYTPAELNELFRLWNERERMAEHRVARIQFTLAQCHDMKINGRRVKFTDYFLFDKKGKIRKPRKQKITASWFRNNLIAQGIKVIKV